MTNMIYSKQEDKYKQVYFPWVRVKPYKKEKIGNDDYYQTTVWRKLKKKRQRIDGYKCAQCGSAINLCVHHIKYPAVWGMEDVEMDLVTLCSECHAKVHSKEIF